MCDYCERNFVRRDSLVKHVRDDHGIHPNTLTKVDEGTTDGTKVSVELCRRKRTTPKMAAPKKSEGNEDLVAEIIAAASKI